MILNLSRTTVARKLIYLGAQSKEKLRVMNLQCRRAQSVQFDDLETFEHTRCKPLSITLAVESQTRRILAFEISQMPANGRLNKVAVRKYGHREDTRAVGRRKFFGTLLPIVDERAAFKSDENPFYPHDFKRFFPDATLETFKSKQTTATGLGELKRGKFDPIFSINHTFAMTRANMNRLIRKTWCTTKLSKRLEDHLAIYAVFHNESLIRGAHKRSAVGQFPRT